MDDARLTDPDEHMPEDDVVDNGLTAQVTTGQLHPVNAQVDDTEEDVYADAGHWMHSISSDSTNSDETESGLKLDLTDIDLTAIAEDEVIPDKGTAHSLGRKVNIVLCALAFVVMFGYLFIAGEGEQTLHAFASFNYAFLLIALVGIVVFWLLEAACMQIICNDLFR